MKKSVVFGSKQNRRNGIEGVQEWCKIGQLEHFQLLNKKQVTNHLYHFT